MVQNGRRRTAIVTGASMGSGRALAGALAGAGWQLIIDARHPGPLQEFAAGIGAHAVPGDVRDAGHRFRLTELAAALGGGLDLLVNNAGTLGASPLPPLADYPLDELAAAFEANVIAPIGLIQAALPLLRPGGAVVNVTSDAAVEGYPGWGGYGSTKAALEQASRVLAAEEPDLRVWWLDPGDMRTAMHQAAFPGEDISDRPEPESVVPSVLTLLDLRPPSGRIRAADLLAGVHR